MTEYLIHFENINWETPHKGVLQKIHSDGSKRLRLLRFNDDFTEKEWCTKGHIGFVLKGEMSINFNGTLKHYKKGNGLWINKGNTDKHKVIIEKGKEVELILFELDE